MLARTQEPVNVLLAMHNPYVRECFDHHPNKDNIRLYDLPGEYTRLRSLSLSKEEFHASLFRAADLPAQQFYDGPAQESPVFYAPDQIRSEGHIVFHPFASTEGRFIPKEIVNEALYICLESGLQVHVVSRNYSKRSVNKLAHPEESLEGFGPHPNLNLHTDLSVPATINLVKSAALFVGAHSSLLQAAWFNNVAVNLVYPPGYPDFSPGKLGHSYAFGVFFPNTVCAPFTAFEPNKLQYQLHLIMNSKPNQITDEKLPAKTGKQRFSSEVQKIKKNDFELRSEIVRWIEQAAMPSGKQCGRGIVIQACGVDDFPSLWVLLNELRRLGCVLP
ncbi:MAG: hypothetical protein OJI67_03900, partial [Prosthecobacter sp.]|nr:hypothetical protein [Prosthecobacter sp.]